MRLATTRLALAATAAAALAACAAGPPEQTAALSAAPPAGAGLPPGQCIRSTEIRNHTIVDNRTLLIDVRGRDTYRVTVAGGCLAGASSTDPIVTRSPPGANLICRPIEMDLGVTKGGFVSSCIVESIDRLSPEEVAALPPRLRP
jgi:hypothetical protein